jgi:predicted SAM-dependent methyltransferase
MVQATSEGSERTSKSLPSVHHELVFAGNRGECLEDLHTGTLVNLGCGHKPWDGWINVDAGQRSKYADVISDIKALPFDSGTVDVMTAIHVVEHFYEWEVVPMLSEWRRVLKPTGLLILELPCMDKVFTYIKNCIMANTGFQAQMTWWAMWGDPRYKDPDMCHKYAYTTGLMKQTLEQAGFDRITVEEPRYHVRQRDMRLTAKPKEST